MTNFTTEMRDRARYLQRVYDSKIDQMWQDEVTWPLEMEFNLSQEDAETLALEEN